jgi:hypothetical protein
MDAPRTARFDDERQAFALRFTCDDCAGFDQREERCRHGWPTEAHRLARYQRERAAEDTVTFCKEFEVP